MIGFHDIYQKYAPAVQGFAYWLCGNEEEARDLTSETFVRLWTHRGNVRGETVKSYLFTIAHRLYLQGLRRSRREGEMPEEPAHPAPNPEQTVSEQARLDRVLKAMQHLSTVDRAALIMRSREGLSYQEIARCLDLSEAAARVKVHRARAKLTELTK